MSTIIIIAVVCVVAIVAVVAGKNKSDVDWKDDRQPAEHNSDKENK